ncbi:MAG: hypothetical protein ACFB13_11890 [Kiloniellaceae bacterium]
MRCLLLIALLTTLAAPALAAQQGAACEGALWKKVRTWLKPAATFQDTILFLQSEGIDFAVFDARTDGDTGADPYGLTDCQPRQEAPHCAVVVSEPRADSRPSGASPTRVETDEIISVDFDAEGKQTGHTCEVVETGL